MNQEKTIVRIEQVNGGIQVQVEGTGNDLSTLIASVLNQNETMMELFKVSIIKAMMYENEHQSDDDDEATDDDITHMLSKLGISNIGLS
jgi:hypothetical protein